jgi:hypothetical protein
MVALTAPILRLLVALAMALAQRMPILRRERLGKFLHQMALVRLHGLLLPLLVSQALPQLSQAALSQYLALRSHLQEHWPTLSPELLAVFLISVLALHGQHLRL